MTVVRSFMWGIICGVIFLAGCTPASTWPTDRENEGVTEDVARIEQTFYIFLGDRKIPMSGEEKTFNVTGNFSEEVRYGRERTFLGKVIYQHNDGLPTSAEVLDTDQKLVMKIAFQFNEAEKERVQQNSDGSGKPLSSVITRYNDQWLGISETAMGNNGEVLQKVLNYYDEKGNRIKMEIYEDSGALETTQTFTFDDKGNELSAKTQDALNGEYLNQFRYTFDDHGNWTQKETILNDKVVELRERKITYQ